MVNPPIYNLGTYDMYNILMNFINDNVTDIRSTRKNKRWVFDEYPTTNDNYPECVVELSNSTTTPNSAAQFLCEDKDVSGNVTREVYFMVEETTAKLRVLTLKDSLYSVSVGGSNKTLKKKAVNLYLAQKIKDSFNFKYLDLINDNVYDSDIKIIEKVRVTSTDKVYESNKFVWASDVYVNVRFKNVYIKEYDGTGELIQTYSLVLNLEDE